MLLLSSLSLASVAFGAWTVGGNSYLLDGGSLQVAPILDASKYVSDANFTCTDFCDQGFVVDSKLVYDGTLRFSFDLRTGLATDSGVDSLATYFGGNDIPVYLDVAYSADFKTYFFATGFQASLSYVATADGSNQNGSLNVIDAENGCSVSFRIPYATNPTGTVHVSVDCVLRTADGYRSKDAFSVVADRLENSNIVFDVWLGR